MSNYICNIRCPYRQQSGYCGSTGGYETCQYTKLHSKQTNADRLNAMSIEEKAAFLQSILTSLPWCKPNAPIDSETKQCLIYDCDKCVIEWLKAEATADAK